MALIKVAEAEEIAPGSCKAVRVEGRDIAVFNISGAFYGIDDACPHRYAPLSDGFVSGEIITCPWHAWQINVRTGEVIYNPHTCVDTYACVLKPDGIYVEIG